MKFQYLYRITLTIFGLLIINILHGQLSPVLEKQLDAVLENPPPAYAIDPEESTRMLNQIDAFFYKHYNLNQAEVFTSDNGQVNSKKIRLRQNVILQPQQTTTQIKKLEAPVEILYTASPQGRSFEKKLRLPVAQALSDMEAIALAEPFLSRGNFVKSTAIDQFKAGDVVARKIRQIAPNADEETERTILQRVVYKRSLNKIPVLNSKTFIDLHPGTKEILGFKTSRWSPIQEKSISEMAIMSKANILERIKEGISDNNYPYEVKNLEVAYFQSKAHVLPVLELTLNPTELARQNGATESRALLIFLNKQLPDPEDDKPLRQPKKRS